MSIERMRIEYIEGRERRKGEHWRICRRGRGGGDKGKRKTSKQKGR